MVSARRIEKFMLLSEVSEEQQISCSSTNVSSSINISKACAKWDNDQQEYTLQDISLNLEEASLNAVVGYVGASKSSFLQMILKELPIESGSVNVLGSISYASQEAFLFSGSVRQNILFGQPFDAERYHTVTRICALDQDFRQLPHKDNTIIGERGTTLSGGQKARVNLARAIYREANVYLLDDPLSAVDPHVSKHLFDKCIRMFLHKKLVILVTNQLEYLEKVDRVIYLEHGKIKAMGTYDELLKLGLDFTKLVEEKDDKQIRTREKSCSDSTISLQRRPSVDASEVDECEEPNTEPDLMEVDEKRERGSIGADVYRKYFRAAGGFCCIAIVALICISSQMFASGADYYWSVWVAKQKTISEQLQYENDFNETSLIELDFWPTILNDPYFDVYVFSAITLLTIITTFWRSFSLINACVRASKTLHNAMFQKITRAHMQFFITNPSGRILNRFSKDIGQIDEILPSIWIDLVQHFLTIFGVIFVTCLVNPFFLIPIIMIGTLFYFLRKYYLKTSSSLKRLEAITRSPIFTHFSASLNGLPTIRAFQAEQILIAEFDSYQDIHSSAFYLFIATNRAFGFCLDFICVFYIAAVTFSFFWMSNSGGNIGLAITQAINFRVQFAVRQSAELENNMTAVERVLEYDDIQTEDLQSKTEKEHNRRWPEDGNIKYDQLSLKYFDDEYAEKVLIDVTFAVKGNEKIGIVGRTGSGKSSLISALFRLFYNQGIISIDSVNTADIGLHDLRSKISIIPQEPVLFSGTVRYNLDPFDQYTDAKLWNTLEEVQLKEVIQDLPAGLLSHITEGGSNFSVGQRQLICLARAILRDNKILVMDEATANVDSNTDALIQKTIRSKFANCTVLTIAHRLNTIMDSDKIIVMNEGRCIEFGPPYELLTSKEGPGVFQAMAKQTGDAYFENYLNVAKKSSKKLN